MENYSYYIKKYFNDIKRAGYTIENNGNQLRKSVDGYDILITDLTVKSTLINIKIILVWIKNQETQIIEKEKYFKNEILPLPFSKINLSAEELVRKLKNTKNKNYVLKNTLRDIEYSVTKDSVKESIR